MAKATGTPTPVPIPTATWLLLGCAFEVGVRKVAADEGKSPNVVDGLGGGIEDGSTERLVAREALVMEVVLLTAEPRVVCIVAWITISESVLPFKG